MKKISFILMAGLLALASCKTIEEDITTHEPEVEPVQGEWTLTIRASKGDAETKALSLDGNTLKAYWLNTETVKVYKGTSPLGELGVTPDGSDNTSATLSGSFESVDGLAQNDELTLLIPRETWNYTGQAGTLESIQTSYDYATATVTINTLDTQNKTITTTAATFDNQQSIYRFAFKKDNAAFSIKDFTVSSAGNRIVSEMTLGGTPTLGGFKVTPASATDAPLFVAIRNTGTEVDTYNFLVTGGDDAMYSVSKEIPARVLDVPGKFISATSLNLTQPSFAPADGTVSNSSNVL